MSPARFLREALGATAVEFAFLAPLFFGVLFFTCQIGLYFYNSAWVIYATNAAARQIMTGAVAQTPNLTASLFRQKYLCPSLPMTMTCSNVITNVFTVPSNGSFYGLPTPVMDNTKTSFCIGQPGSYVVVQVFYAMPVLGISSMLPNAKVYNDHPSVFINSSFVFVNEPYSTGSNSC